MLSTPVAVCVFNRPDQTRRLFETLARVEPRHLFVFADGPRSDDEAEVCARVLDETRRVDWDCEVRYDVSPVNLGSRYRVVSGLDWVFSQVDEAIYLEDDLDPDPTFFPFCETLLERYRDDTRVMAIVGTNYLERWQERRQSYHFSYFANAPGWATWKRAWATHDISMAAWGDDDVKRRIRELIANDEAYAFQAPRFDRHAADPERRYGWDPGWMLARMVHGGLTVVPAVNLITNRGNTDGRGLPPEHPLACIPSTPMTFPLRPPPAVEVDRDYDARHVRRIHEWWDQRAEGMASAARARRRRDRVTRRFRTLIGRSG